MSCSQGDSLAPLQLHTQTACVCLQVVLRKDMVSTLTWTSEAKKMTEMKEWLWVSLEAEGIKDDRSEALRLMQSAFNGVCTFPGCGRLYTSRIHVVNKGQLFVNMSSTVIPPASAQEVHTCRDYNSEQRWAQWYQVYFVRVFTGETNIALFLWCPILCAYGKLFCQSVWSNFI